ncbi:MAG: hypothetical protein U1E27_02425 [Kiritimatiellia bacterium]|nr:hypothetical protein [Kiritimatiellia bacterium]
MSKPPTNLLGGASVYCINDAQMREAARLLEQDPESAPRLKSVLDQLETSLHRNERAALAFLLIDRLRTPPEPPRP